MTLELDVTRLFAAACGRGEETSDPRAHRPGGHGADRRHPLRCARGRRGPLLGERHPSPRPYPRCCPFTLSSGTASRSVSTASSPTGRSPPAGRSRSPSSPSDRWPTRAVRSVGWPTTGATTCSPTRPATRTRRSTTVAASPASCKGLWHAHLGWLFTARSASPPSRRRPLVGPGHRRASTGCSRCGASLSLALPFGLGWLLGGTFGAAVSALFWAGLVRVCVLHHATWSINSVCHMFGRRPFATKDRSGNVGVLAVVSMGESWHNGHHAFPRSARHGLLHGQLDTSALLVRGFERMAWVSDVHWPTAESIRNRRVGTPSSALTTEIGGSGLSEPRTASPPRLTLFRHRRPAAGSPRPRRRSAPAAACAPLR